MSNIREAVTSFGDSWIICRSKSHIGRIYYFNTSTGEAAWSLDEIEAENAKKRTSIIQNQPGFAIEDCPEPLEAPQQPSILEKPTPVYHSTNIQKLSQAIVTPKAYNKQIINDQFPKTLTQYPNQFLQYNPMNPMQFNVPFPSTFNPSVWNVTPQQVFVTPTFNQPQPSINNTDNVEYVPITNTHESLTNRFKKLSEVQQAQVKLSVNNIEKPFAGGPPNQYQHKRNNHIDPLNKHNSNMDLRFLLSNKRRKSLSIADEAQDSVFNDFYNNHNDTNHLNIGVYPDKRRRSYSFNANEENYGECDDDDDNWLKENMRSQGYNNTIDIKALRKVLHITENSDSMWYIVTDSNVLLNNVNFLNVLLNSDQHCCLMIPQIVMNKIKCATNSRLRTQAHRAAYFILQQVDANLAIIDESTESSNNSSDEIINCCVRLIDLGYRIVLITDDIELHNNENASKISIFTIKTIKQLVSKTKSTESPNTNLDMLPYTKGQNIKITIKNNRDIKFNDKSSEPWTEKCISAEVVEKKSDPFHSNNIKQINKKINEVGVQTDSTPFPKIAVGLSKKSILPNSSNVNEKKNVTSKISGLKLKRHLTYNATLKPKATEKRNVWHRYKVNSSSSLSDAVAQVGDGIASICTITDFTIKENDNENLASGTSSYASTESLCKPGTQNYDGGSESSSVIFKDMNPHESITIEETSLGASNTPRKVISGSDRSVLQKVNTGFNQDNAVLDANNVMFEVTDLRMEEFLKMKSDEWVSRFIQILEEALTQVLHLKPSFVLDSMPPPWTVHEAAECVKKKFHNDRDVVDAATKLLSVSFEIGGLRGKIKPNISPNKFMEFYSYGVYIIDALQGILNNNEDLQTAAESLSKLLRDIQHSHLDASNQDSFTENNIVNTRVQEHKINLAEDKSKNISKTIRGDNNKHHNEELQELNLVKTSSKRQTIAPGLCDLRSLLRKSNLEEKEDSAINNTFTKIVENESSLFPNLCLKKKLSAETEKANSVNDSRTNDGSLEKTSNTSLQKNDNHANVSDEVSDKVAGHETKLNEPKIIRNFTKCREFEEKLKNKSRDFDDYSWIDDNEDYTEDYANDDDEYMDGVNENYSNGLQRVHKFAEDEMCKLENMPNHNSNVHNKKNLDIFTEDKKTVPFKLVMEKLERDIKKAYSTIQDFCIQSCESLRSANINAAYKCEMQERAEKTYSYINDICGTLIKILEREKYDKGISALLSGKEYAEKIACTESDMDDYRKFIHICLEQGSILKESVSLLLKVSKE